VGAYSEAISGDLMVPLLASVNEQANVTPWTLGGDNEQSVLIVSVSRLLGDRMIALGGP